MADVNEMITLLKKEYPGVKIALHYSDPLELLIATILSAQCTDKQVNGVTKNLFKKYRTLQDYIKPPRKNLKRTYILRDSTGIRQKILRNCLNFSLMNLIQKSLILWKPCSHSRVWRERLQISYYQVRSGK